MGGFKGNMPFYFRFSAFTQPPCSGTHTQPAQWHPTHQLSSHVKFTPWADRLETAASVVWAFASACRPRGVCLWPSVACASVFVCDGILLVWEGQGWNVMLGEHLTQSSREKKSMVETISRILGGCKTHASIGQCFLSVLLDCIGELSVSCCYKRPSVLYDNSNWPWWLPRSVINDFMAITKDGLECFSRSASETRLKDDWSRKPLIWSCWPQLVISFVCSSSCL